MRLPGLRHYCRKFSSDRSAAHPDPANNEREPAGCGGGGNRGCGRLQQPPRYASPSGRRHQLSRIAPSCHGLRQSDGAERTDDDDDQWRGTPDGEEDKTNEYDSEIPRRGSVSITDVCDTKATLSCRQGRLARSRPACWRRRPRSSSAACCRLQPATGPSRRPAASMSYRKGLSPGRRGGRSGRSSCRRS
jgi:hypothetical protein